MTNNIVAVCTIEEVREEFRRRGISVSDWARRQGVSAQLTYRILAGRTLGLRGQSHEICVLLGLKPGVIGSARLYAVLCGKPRSHFAEAGLNG